MKKITIIIFICLLAVSLIFGCTDNQDNLAQGKNPRNMTDESPNKNTLDKEYAGNINSLQLEKQSSFSKYYSKENQIGRAHV